ncbi:MAG: putative Ig domain-containing protein [Blastocatellales bacterium]
MRNRLPVFLFSLLTAISLYAFNTTSAFTSTTYEVGAGKPYPNIGDVPWESLQPGDTVLIHYRPAPYKEKWVICRQGTAAAPITVRGVLGPNGELPMIDGNGATTRLALDFWSETRGVIKIGGANIPADTMPRYITIENLDIRSARSSYTFSDDNGATQTYAANASSIYVEKGENITVRNCAIHDSGNGFFVASSDAAVSRDILVEGNYIYDNGNTGSIYEHNNYTAAIGITFQYNRFGPLRAGAGGNNLKDRSAGLAVRYNWIEGGNRQLDLVDGEDSSIIRNDPRYRETHVYGNILVEPDAAGNRQITHYGGDSGGSASYRKGILYFYNNTVVSTRADRTTLFRLSTNDERCDARNNIFYVSAAGSTLSLLDTDGVLDLSHNWFKPGWAVSFGTFQGAVNNDGTSVQTSSPGFVNEAAQNYYLASGSACINAGGALNPLVLPAHDLPRQYVKHQMSEARPNDGQRDIGAYETQSASPADLIITTTSLPSGAVGGSYSATVAATGGDTPYAWSIVAGSLPVGLSLNLQTGAISGTPATAGTSNFTVQVTDAQSQADTATKSLSIMVNAPAPLNITTTSLPKARRNRSYSRTLQATGGLTPYSWSLSAGSLPPGLSLNASTGVISGTPTTRGTWSFSARVQDSQAPAASDTQSLSIIVRR